MNKHVLSLAIAVFIGSALSVAQAAPPAVKPSPSTPVEVTNTTQNPVPVVGLVDVTETKLPFARLLQCFNQTTSPTSGSNSCSVQFTVPAGKRLELEYVSLRCASGEDGIAADALPLVVTLGADISHYLNLPTGGLMIDGNASFGRIWTSGQKLLAHAEPEATVYLEINFTKVSKISCNMSFSGYEISAN